MNINIEKQPPPSIIAIQGWRKSILADPIRIESHDIVALASPLHTFIASLTSSGVIAPQFIPLSAQCRDLIDTPIGYPDYRQS